ncbi:MAG: right-handed parallel beta-helix repeat-containing protein [Kiritimatiellae bacterium]|nr:right-handed parallel beta-helix repeat-containing protein [Kiritimatiellia bacterium]
MTGAESGMLAAVSGGAVFDPRLFGAKGDGVADDTSAIQKAIDEAFKANGVVAFTPGEYLTGELMLRHGSTLRGEQCCRYHYFEERPVVRLKLRSDATSRCLINISESRGSRLFGLDLVGPCGKERDVGGIDHTGERIVHGIMLDHEKFGPYHDSPTIDSCHIRSFSGDGVHLNRCFVFTLRFTSVCSCGGNGVWLFGWDGFMTDCTFNGNIGAAFIGELYDPSYLFTGASCTFTGNRVEWNHGGGFVLKNNVQYNITGNYFDRNGDAALVCEDAQGVAATGNIFYRNGKDVWTDNPLGGGHVRIVRSRGVTVTGNSFTWGFDDDKTGKPSPDYSVHIKDSTDCVVMANAMNEASVEALIVDGGGNRNCIVKDNAGSVVSREKLAAARLPDILVCERGSGEIRVYDALVKMTAPKALLWSWSARDDRTIPAADAAAFADRVADCKPAGADARIAVVSGGGRWAVVDRASKKALSWGRLEGEGRSVAFLPDGLIAVASTAKGGAGVSLASATAGGPAAMHPSGVPFDQPGGLHFDAKDGLLWILDRSGVHAAKVVRGAAPALESAGSYPCEGFSAPCDLMPVPNTRVVMATAKDKVRAFDLDRRRWLSENEVLVKNLNSYDSCGPVGPAVTVQAADGDGSCDVLIEKDGSARGYKTLPGARFHKARWITPAN